MIEAINALRRVPEFHPVECEYEVKPSVRAIKLIKALFAGCAEITSGQIIKLSGLTGPHSRAVMNKLVSDEFVSKRKCAIDGRVSIYKLRGE